MLLTCAQAPGADVEPLPGSIDHQRGAVHIGRPDAVGVAFGMAHVVTSLVCLPADFAHCHGFLIPQRFDKHSLCCKITSR